MYQVPVVEAMQITGATCKASGLYQRLQCHWSQEAAAEEIATAEHNNRTKNNVAGMLWLGEIVQGMTWDEHMVAAALEIGKQWEADGEILGEDLRLDAPPIFSLGGV